MADQTQDVAGTPESAGTTQGNGVPQGTEAPQNGGAPQGDGKPEDIATPESAETSQSTGTTKAAGQTVHHTHGEHVHPTSLPLLALTALGIVYGDIGTSPLYALRESFHGPHGIAPTPLHIYGVLSMVFWSLIIVITVKYVGFILRADNHGEGGVLSLTSLATPIRPLKPTRRRWIVLIGVFGAALLYGDAVLTPAISVLSAVEGLAVATPVFAPYIVPITIVILVGLFLIQSRGTASIGQLFGPVMLVWFSVLALIGLSNIVRNPSILWAINPIHAVNFFAADGLTGFLVVGTVFLVVTGGEALYADMGHVGRKPIQIAWLVLVLPALLLNYFGQGAVLLENPEAAANLFYRSAPAWALYPLVALASLATVIASQALISGVFSITMQAENLGFLPRVRVIHTSPTAFGQIYIPMVNWTLMAGCIIVVLAFQTSSNLTAAYGIAVTMTMAITTVLFSIIARERWRWSWPVVLLLCGSFLLVDLAFVSANLVKIAQGGWLPLVTALVIFTVMTTWKRGNRLVNVQEQTMEKPLDELLDQLRREQPVRAPGAAVFLSANPDGVPAALIANVRYNGSIHEQVVLVNVALDDAPTVAPDKRATLENLGEGFFRVTIHYGFMEEFNVPRALASVMGPQLHFDTDRVPYYIGRTKVLPSELPGMALWREHLYTLMQRNAASAADFFCLPPAQVVEISTSVEV
ncbi:MAG TPA: potassium transporter Kup [Roseiflexaceae bacterium]|nr:potassium transporter Kup [Roseiflexaceae bacterium]